MNNASHSMEVVLGDASDRLALPTGWTENGGEGSNDNSTFNATIGGQAYAIVVTGGADDNNNGVTINGG